MLLKFKYSLLLFIYLLIIAIYPLNTIPNPLIVLSILSLFFVIKIISKVNKYVFLGFLFFIASIISLQSIYAFVYKSQVGYSEIEVIFLTNSTESSGMLASIFIPIIITLCISFFLVFSSASEIKRAKISYKYILIFFGCFLIGGGGYFIYSSKQGMNVAYYKDAKSLFIYYYLRETNPIIYTPLYTTVLCYKDLKRYEEVRHLPKEMPNGISINDTFDLPFKNIYVILGESLNRKNMSLYGYNAQQTTPFLDSLASNTDQVLFYDAISIANMTNRSIPLIITSSDVNNWHDHFKHYTSIELAHMKGLNTYWISNQPKTNMFNSLSYSSEPTNLGVSTNNYHFASNDIPLEDLNLIPNYLKTKNKEDQKRLVFFHMRGSHMPYYAGYDDRDTQDIKESLAIDKSEVEYNRTIRHTDRVIRDLYKTMNTDTDIIIFVSDHGEEIGVGHSTQSLLKDQYTVPYVIISKNNSVSNDFLNQFVSPDNIISTHSVFFLLCHLMGYNIDPSLIEQAQKNTKFVLNTNAKHSFDNLSD